MAVRRFALADVHNAGTLFTGWRAAHAVCPVRANGFWPYTGASYLPISKLRRIIVRCTLRVATNPKNVGVMVYEIGLNQMRLADLCQLARGHR